MPKQDEEYENLNEIEPAMANEFWSNQLLLYLKGLSQNAEYQIGFSKNLIHQIQQQNATINHRLRLALNEDLRHKLEETLKQNNSLIHFLIELNNLFLNNVQFYEWIQLQYGYRNQNNLYKENTNSLDENAQKARFYPHPTPLHYAPLRDNPFV